MTNEIRKNLATKNQQLQDGGFIQSVLDSFSHGAQGVSLGWNIRIM